MDIVCHFQSTLVLGDVAAIRSLLSPSNSQRFAAFLLSETTAHNPETAPALSYRNNCLWKLAKTGLKLEYLLFSTFTVAFQDQYGFSTSLVGLTFLGLGIGNLLALAIISPVLDKLAKGGPKPTEADLGGGKKPPEFRLIPLAYCSFSLPAGLFLYGWTMEYRVHWIVPIIGTAIYGFGQMAVFLCIIAYLIDAFELYAASALAANTVVRSIFGAVLPLAGATMYHALGYGWGNSLLGFLALAMVPIPILLTKFGERMRKRLDLSRI